MADDAHLSKLRQLLGTRTSELFPCIEDLVLHGLDLGRFAPDVPRPSRQDVAQYLATWLRHAGLTEDLFCATWFAGYCGERLAAISTSSALSKSADRRKRDSGPDTRSVRSSWRACVSSSWTFCPSTWGTSARRSAIAATMTSRRFAHRR